MKFFIDTANLDMIKEIDSWGILDGVTTNPSLVAKEGTDTPTRVAEIAKGEHIESMKEIMGKSDAEIRDMYNKRDIEQ